MARAKPKHRNVREADAVKRDAEPTRQRRPVGKPEEVPKRIRETRLKQRY